MTSTGATSPTRAGAPTYKQAADLLSGERDEPEARKLLNALTLYLATSSTTSFKSPLVKIIPKFP